MDLFGLEKEEKGFRLYIYIFVLANIEVKIQCASKRMQEFKNIIETLFVWG